jgi:Mg-chelatase subunit ChlD
MQVIRKDIANISGGEYHHLIDLTTVKLKTLASKISQRLDRISQENL